ncbi:hypothetical protein EPN96_07715 [bacterium]|nr:MAG: hypothetical protein EPN96_07715 [bacterium]
MFRKIILLLAVVFAFAQLSNACVGKSLIIGTDGTVRSKVVANVLAILINERTGTTVEISDYDGPEGLFKEMTTGDVDLGLMYAGEALIRGQQPLPPDPKGALEAVKNYHQEKFNLVWLPELGFSESGNPYSLAASVAQKHTLKKFPALSRLIAKTQGKLSDKTVDALGSAPSISKAVRDFLKAEKLI